jgi:hypothetical protein
MVLDHLNFLKVLAERADKAAHRARQWDYLKGFRGFPNDDALLYANTLSPTDPPIVTAEGAIRLNAFSPPKRDPVLLVALHVPLLSRWVLRRLEHSYCLVKG